MKTTLTSRLLAFQTPDTRHQTPDTRHQHYESDLHFVKYLTDNNPLFYQDVTFRQENTPNSGKSNPADTANKGCRIWHSVIPQGETPPTNPDDLRRSFFTKRKKDLIDFDFGDSGKTAYFAVQIENEGKKGPWGPLVSALIP